MFDDKKLDEQARQLGFHSLEEACVNGYMVSEQGEVVPTREAVIEALQNSIHHNRIADIKALKEAIAGSDYTDIAPYEEVLHPMSYNTCDRCGDIEDSEVGFFWLDGFDWEDGNPTDQAILKALSDEKNDYCAVCYHCLEELKENGRKALTTK